MLFGLSEKKKKKKKIGKKRNTSSFSPKARALLKVVDNNAAALKAVQVSDCSLPPQTGTVSSGIYKALLPFFSSQKANIDTQKAD